MLDKLRLNLANILVKDVSGWQPSMGLSLQNVGIARPGQPVYKDFTMDRAVQEAYKVAIPVYRAVRAIIQAASGIPWVVQTAGGQEIPHHDFTELWAHPNPEFSYQDNIEYIISHIILCGNAYLRPIYGGGLPRELWVEIPDRIAPVPGKTLQDWLQGYEYTDINGRKEILPRETFLHFKQVDPGNLYIGVGAIQAAWRAIQTYNEGMDTQKVSMQNRGIPSGHLWPVGNESMTAEQFASFKKMFREMYQGVANAREPWLYAQEMKWQEANMTPVEMDYTNSQLFLVRQVAAAMGIDPWWLGDREGSTYNNVKEARRALYEDVALPILDDIKAELNLKLAPLYGGNIVITYDTSNVPVLREDLKDKVATATQLYSMGVPFSQINQKLELGFEDFPGSDMSHLPIALIPVGDDGLPTMPEPEPADDDTKAIKSEDVKAAQWRRMDARRNVWASAVEGKFTALYIDLGKLVAKDLDPKKAIAKATPAWEKTLTAVYMAVAKDIGDQTQDGMKTERKFDPATQPWVRKWVARNVAAKVKTILETQRDSMAAVIADGISKDLTTRQIASSITGYYATNAKTFAWRVARTETAAAASAGQIGAGLEANMTRKVWLSTRDDRTRDSHADMDGESVKMGSTFSNGCDAPGIGDDPGEVINCRCVLTFTK